MKKAPFKIGDRVTTTFRPVCAEVVRLVTKVIPDPSFPSQYRVSVDGGEACTHCGRTAAIPLRGLDAAWFKLVG